jgi:hypothetical protein
VRLISKYKASAAVLAAVLSAVLAAESVAAQDVGGRGGDAPVVEAAFDRDSVMIGDQFTLEVRVSKDMMQAVGFPEFLNGEIAPGVELLEEFAPDTLASDGRRHTIGKRYRVTIWEEGDYRMSPYPAIYADKNVVDTLWSKDSLRVRVTSFAIDLEKDKPLDIKPPAGLRLRFGEIAGWLALALAVAALVVLGVWLVRKYRRHIPLLGGARPDLPPHVEAIRRLEALRLQRLPQSGKHKQYYSGLTDILRTYLERRFGIGAMEMTSAEIVEAVEAPRRAGEVDDKRRDDLAALLAEADLVKFAKWEPAEADNDRAYYDAYYFVEETKAAVEGRAEETEKEI